MKMRRPAAQVFKPALNLLDATAIGLGAIIGGGIFVVTGIVAGLAGPALILSILVAAGISLLTAFSYMELTAWRPSEGSVYIYAGQLLSPAAGFLAGWMWVIANLFSGAAVALGFAHYLAAFLPAVPVKGAAVSLCLVFTALNYRGVRSSAGVNNILVAVKLLTLLVFILGGLLHFNPAHFSPFVASGTGIFYGASFIFFAFAGFARVSVLGQEVKEPRRTIPRSIVLALGISTVIYILVGVAALGLLKAETLAASNSPLADAIRILGRPILVYVVSSGGLVAMASVLLTSVLGVSRMSYAMAQSKDLPAFLARIHLKHGTPSAAVLSAGGLIAVVAALMPFTGAVAISAFSSLFCYALANASALRLGLRSAPHPKMIPVAGLATCLLLLAFIPWRSIKAGIVGLLLGGLLYLGKKMIKTVL